MLGLVPSNPRNRRVVSGILAALPPASLPMRRALYLVRSTPLPRCPRRLTPRPAALHCSLRRCSGDTCEDDDDGRPRIYASYDSWADELFPAPGNQSTGGDSSPADPVWRKEKVEVDGGGRPTPAAAQWSGLKRKAPKNKSSWVCANCGESFSQWWGSCRSCGETSTLKQFSLSGKGDDEGRGPRVAERIAGAWLPRGQGSMRPQRLSEVIGGMNQSEWRISLSGLFGAEVSRVLGGGVVPGSLVLVGGDPGVGKSTLLLQIAAILAEGTSCGEPAPVVYISGEESIEQIGHRANRMRIGTDSLFLYSSTDIEDILDKVQSLSPRAVIVDSIQTVYLKSATGSAGGLSQVRECTSQFLCYAKQTKIPIFLIGHVTKSGDIAGPRVLEHIVDTVLYMEGERYSSHRLLRSVKNRFGSTDELGVFEMSAIGLQAVTNPSEIFLSEDYIHSEVLAGLAVAVIVDSSRTFLIEIQALCASSPTVSRHYNGVSGNRADMIVSVLIKQAGLKLQDNAIFLNIVSGFKLEETAGDLAIAAAICSSFLEVPIPKDVAFIGEIGLGGELRMVPRMDKRVTAISKLGYRKCVIPKTAEKLLKTLDLGDLIVIGCSNLKDVINQVFA